MTDKEIHYEVIWGQKSRVKLAEMKPFKIDPKMVFRNSKSILSVKPREKADDVADYPDFEFNGYYWKYINNVIVVYDVLEEERKVLVDACYSALTGFTLQRFYGEHDTDPLRNMGKHGDGPSVPMFLEVKGIMAYCISSFISIFLFSLIIKVI